MKSGKEAGQVKFVNLLIFGGYSTLVSISTLNLISDMTPSHPDLKLTALRACYEVAGTSLK